MEALKRHYKLLHDNNNNKNSNSNSNGCPPEVFLQAVTRKKVKDDDIARMKLGLQPNEPIVANFRGLSNGGDTPASRTPNLAVAGPAKAHGLPQARDPADRAPTVTQRQMTTKRPADDKCPQQAARAPQTPQSTAAGPAKPGQSQRRAIVEPASRPRQLPVSKKPRTTSERDGMHPSLLPPMRRKSAMASEQMTANMYRMSRCETRYEQFVASRGYY